MAHHDIFVTKKFLIVTFDPRFILSNSVAIAKPAQPAYEI